MRINIDELTYEEIKDVVERLQRLRMESEFKRRGDSVFIQTKEETRVNP